MYFLTPNELHAKVVADPTIVGTGVKVAFTDERSLVAGLSDALAAAIRTPARLDALGAAARARVLAKLTWDAKAEQILAVYAAVLDRVDDLGHLDTA